MTTLGETGLRTCWVFNDREAALASEGNVGWDGDGPRPLPPTKTNGNRYFTPEVVSAPDAALKVTRLNLTPEGERMLSVGRSVKLPRSPARAAYEGDAPPRRKTRGEEIAERMVIPVGVDGTIRVQFDGDFRLVETTNKGGEKERAPLVAALRKTLAKAIDKATADRDREWAKAMDYWLCEDDGDLRFDPNYVADTIRACYR